MRHVLLVLPMTLAASAALAGPEPAPPYNPAEAALRAECAQLIYNSGSVDGKRFGRQDQDSQSYDGRVGCSEDEYADYLDSVDPARVMAAYPSGAGRPASSKQPAAKPKDSHVDANKLRDQTSR